MKRWLWGATLVIGLLLLGGRVHTAQAQRSGGEIPAGALYVPGEVIVAFEEGWRSEAYRAQANALAERVGAQVVKLNRNLALLQAAEDVDVFALAEQISQMDGVAYAEPNYIRWVPEMELDTDKVVGDIQEPTGVTFRIQDARTGEVRELTLDVRDLRAMKDLRRGKRVPTYPNDPNLWSQWGWDYIEADIIWPDRAKNPAVCVIDTGVDRGHPELRGRVVRGYDFVNEDRRPDDDHGHGTHVAGTIAAKLNNKKGFAGISTAKIVPVKVLSAQGWGTAYDIAQGIYYCADRRDVKVINMSLGGSIASRTEYDALDYAINVKGKLVVAAAGNSGRAYWDRDGSNSIVPGTTDTPTSFPAGWAVPWVCKDGTLAPNAPTVADCAPGNENTLADGLISVGAAAAPRPWYATADGDRDGYLWVDSNGNGVQDIGEEHWSARCAAYFSNYGAWVEIVAPGEDILSTLPTSYNFYARYFWGSDLDGDGYESWSGTSMATPHVAAAAARAWSVFKTETNVQIANRLVNTGDALVLVSDPNMVSPWEGYWDTGYAGEMPFCWPDATYGPLYDMSNASYLNVAGAMERAGIAVAVSDAVTGLPLRNARVFAFDQATGKGKDVSVVSEDSRWTFLINLPAAPGGQNYDIKVARRGYTTGAVWVGWIKVSPGYLWSDPSLQLGVPPLGRITAVLNWANWYTDLDLYVWLPTSVPGGGAVVGPGGSGHPLDIGVGELSDFPRARWNRDGGWGDWLNLESMTIVPKPGKPDVPYYNDGPTDAYSFLVTDYGTGDLNQYAIVRIWAKGKIVGVLETNAACTGGEPWWYVGDIVLNTFIPVDQCGTGAAAPGGIWPYAETGGTGGIFGQPTDTNK